MNHHATDLRGRGRQAGMTVLEIMIVLAIVGGLVYISRSGFRAITKADLVDDATELTAVMTRTSQLAIENGEMYRVLLDFDASEDKKRPDYVVEVCAGQTAIQRNEATRVEKSVVDAAVERAKTRLNGVPVDSVIGGDADTATRRATALAGHHVADRECHVVTDSTSGVATKAMLENVDESKLSEEEREAREAKKNAWARVLRKGKVKFKEAWVQHRDDSVTKGQVAIYFFPTGASEKAVIELTDGSEVFSVLVFGLTGRVELRDGVLRDVNDHMMKNVMGDKDAKREDQQ